MRRNAPTRPDGLLDHGDGNLIPSRLGGLDVGPLVERLGVKDQTVPIKDDGGGLVGERHREGIGEGAASAAYAHYPMEIHEA